jgi:hypothetical protein
MKDLWETAITRASAALGLQPSQPFDNLNFSVFLKYILVSRLEAEGLAIESFRLLPPVEKKQQLAGIAGLAGKRIQVALKLTQERIVDDERFEVSQDFFERIGDDAGYLGRVAQLAVEQYMSERVAPELCLAPSPFSRHDTSAALPGAFDYVVIFESFPNFANELYPLIIDAYETDLQDHGSPTINVIGAHINWWTDEGCLSRGIFMRHEDHWLIEAGFENPRFPSALHCLCMSAKSHQMFSNRARGLHIREMNPYEPFARTADDKFECFRCWETAGVATPGTILLLRGSPTPSALLDEAQARWQRESPAAGIVIQPNHGTEGLGAAYLPTGTDRDAALEIIRRTWQADDAVVRKEIRGVRFTESTPTQPPPSRGRSVSPSPLEGEGWGEGRETLACDLRVNVSYDGSTWRAESGYLQVSGDARDPITSPGRGGRIEKFGQGALDRLAIVDEDGAHPVSLSERDWNKISEAAIAAVSALPGKCPLAGVDVRLVPRRGRSGAQVEACILDVNPRPAGLAHSEFLPEKGKTAEPGVTRDLWRQVRCLDGEG